MLSYFWYQETIASVMSLKLHVWLRSIHLWEASAPCSWKLPKAVVPFQSKQLPNTLLGGSDGLIAWFFSDSLPIKWNENNLRSSTPTCCSRSATKSARPVSKVWRRKRSKAASYGHLRPKYRFLKCFILFENLIKEESPSDTQSWWKKMVRFKTPSLPLPPNM